MTHTPGPWVMGQTPFNYEDALVSADGQVIAYASWGGGSSCNLAFENEADAHLIAAAPDLLAACEALVAKSTDTTGDWSREWNAALSAIARAKGE